MVRSGRLRAWGRPDVADSRCTRPRSQTGARAARQRRESSTHLAPVNRRQVPGTSRVRMRCGAGVRDSDCSLHTESRPCRVGAMAGRRLPREPRHNPLFCPLAAGCRRRGANGAGRAAGLPRFHRPLRGPPRRHGRGGRAAVGAISHQATVCAAGGRRRGRRAACECRGNSRMQRPSLTAPPARFLRSGISYLHLEWQSTQSLLQNGGEFTRRALTRVRVRFANVRRRPSPPVPCPITSVHPLPVCRAHPPRARPSARLRAAWRTTFWTRRRWRWSGS